MGPGGLWDALGEPRQDLWDALYGTKYLVLKNSEMHFYSIYIYIDERTWTPENVKFGRVDFFKSEYSSGYSSEYSSECSSEYSSEYSQ